MLRAAAACWTAVDVKTGMTGEAATAATGEAGESTAGKAMDMSKSEGPMAEPKESKPRTGESSRAEKGLEDMEDSSLERAAKDKSAASHSSKPLTALAAGATNMSLAPSTRTDAFLPTIDGSMKNKWVSQSVI
jgi:hypothetical protein